MVKAAGEGRERGRTGRVSEWDARAAEGGRRGSSAQLAERTRAWMGKSET